MQHLVVRGTPVQMLVGGMVVCVAVSGECPPGWANGVIATLWPLLTAGSDGEQSSGPLTR